jgi:hypothetical protein
VIETGPFLCTAAAFAMALMESYLYRRRLHRSKNQLIKWRPGIIAMAAIDQKNFKCGPIIFEKPFIPFGLAYRHLCPEVSARHARPSSSRQRHQTISRYDRSMQFPITRHFWRRAMLEIAALQAGELHALQRQDIGRTRG